MKRYSVMSYEGFLKKVSSSKTYLKDKVCIVDEAHRIRSVSGKIASIAVRSLQQSYKSIPLTGTPMVNSPVDMSPIVNSIVGENILPMNEKQFKQMFYVQKSKKIPPDNKRCAGYSPATCSDDGFAVKKGMCKYHYYMKMRRAPLKVRKQLNFKRDHVFEKK